MFPQKIDQNQTKLLKSAQNHQQERKILASIFSLDENNELDQVKLEFHGINYLFSKQNNFSNEQQAAILEILDEVLQKMLDHRMNQQDGLQMLTDQLHRTSIHRPPYTIGIFSQDQVKKILEFAQESFLQHFSLYQFAFLPKIDLLLKTEAQLQTRFYTNLHKLEESVEVVDTEQYKRILDKKVIEISEDQQDLHLPSIPEIIQPVLDPKVGKIYGSDEPLHDVINKEFSRLNRSLEHLLSQQNESVERPKSGAQNKKK